MIIKKLLLILFAGGLLSACAQAELASHVAKNVPYSKPSAPSGFFKVGKPYKVFGQYYTPREQYDLIETGIASWYGPNFHGKQTANGEIFDQNELTAAHRTLQLPSLVRVTNLENGRSLIVRVNDRGPFKRGRIIDLSKRAAELLDFKNQGTAKVRVEVLPQESLKIAEMAKQGHDTAGVEVALNKGQPVPPLVRSERTPALQRVAAKQPPATPPAAKASPPLEVVRAEPARAETVPGHLTRGKFYPDPVVEKVPVPPTSIFVQAGSFAEKSNAERLAQALQSIGPADVQSAVVGGKRFYRVRMPAQNVAKADALLSELNDNRGINALIVVE